jgi:hypothetical protein
MSTIATDEGSMRKGWILGIKVQYKSTWGHLFPPCEAQSLTCLSAYNDYMNGPYRSLFSKSLPKPPYTCIGYAEFPWLLTEVQKLYTTIVLKVKGPWSHLSDATRYRPGGRMQHCCQIFIWAPKAEACSCKLAAVKVHAAVIWNRTCK